MSTKHKHTDFQDSLAKEGTDDALKYFGDAFENFQIRNSAEELKRLIRAVMEREKEEGGDVQLPDDGDSEEAAEKIYRSYLLEKLSKGCSGSKEKNKVNSNIRNWFSGKHRTMKRKSAIEILLALEVDDIEANDYIFRLCGDEAYALYASRDYQDIVYAFCLRNKRGIKDAEGLIDKYAKYVHDDLSDILKEVLSNITDDQSKIDEVINKIDWHSFYRNEHENGKNVIKNFCKDNKLEKEKLEQAIDEYMELLDVCKTTSLLHHEFYDIEEESALDAFFKANKYSFSSFRRTAHKNFIKFYEDLKKPYGDFIMDRDDYEDLTNPYDVLVTARDYYEYLTNPYNEFFMAKDYSEELTDPYNVNLMDEKKLSDEKIYQKIIRIGDNSEKMKYVPSDTEINARTRTRTISVVQKVLAKSTTIDDSTLKEVKIKQLQVPRKYLILVFMHAWGLDIKDEREPIYALNKLLEESGMPILDSRNPFDWLIMNSLFWESKGEGDFYAIDRVKEVVWNVYQIEI